jgi:hypothetical protein
VDGDAPIICGVEMGGDSDENPARLLSDQRRWCMWVSFPSLEALPRCVAISLAHLEFVSVFG